MSTAADAVRSHITPLLPGWRIQFGRWMDDSASDRYAVLRPVGGMPASLLREPRFTLLLVASVDDEATHAYDTASTLVESMRGDAPPPEGLISVRAGEPVASATSDGRPMAEIAITTITD